ncbi:hypothetical protein E2562_016421 [Oryza meyeriana var. granulata]|uniref:Uncharacterized protein n=1 Tax=Oryza meyeriana var. granulata TaxID=110450 RepID=A0A6G1EX04_9ORYZ|nr:hypothetical protein E2562_016421 [Oryza meyeriana var. granulata]
MQSLNTNDRRILGWIAYLRGTTRSQHFPGISTVGSRYPPGAVRCGRAAALSTVSAAVFSLPPPPCPPPLSLPSLHHRRFVSAAASSPIASPPSAARVCLLSHRFHLRSHLTVFSSPALPTTNASSPPYPAAAASSSLLPAAASSPQTLQKPLLSPLPPPTVPAMNREDGASGGVCGCFCGASP